MAYCGLQPWELLCPVCQTFIEVIDNNDLQVSLDYHYSNVHPILRDISRANNHVQTSKDTITCTNDRNVNQPRQECTSCVICPLCDNVVEVFQNNINHCFMEHFEIYHQNELKLGPSDNNLSVEIGRGSMTVVLETTKNKDEISPTQEISSKCLSSNFIHLPSNLEKQSGFINFNNNLYICNICRETLNTQQIMEYHLKTKQHEDNAIAWLKTKLPKHMHTAMEFVSFYGANLCCNLCRCKIDLNSVNPHETLVNIISHNTDVKHTQEKSCKDVGQNSIAYEILESLSKKNPLVNEHRGFIHTEMEPHFKCNLCDKIIQYSKSDFELEQNFLIHIKSVLHIKNSKATNVLNFFIEMNGDNDRKHCYTVSNGLINCTQCKCTIEANVELLLEHCKSDLITGINHLSGPNNTLHTSVPLSSNKPTFTSKGNSHLEKTSLNETTKKSFSNSQCNPMKTVRKQIKETVDAKKLNVKEIVHPLQNQFGNITCIAEGGDGKLTCLICNCSIQPSTHCVKMHIMGGFHKKKTKCQIEEFGTLNLQIGETNKELVLNRREKPVEESYQDLIQHLFQSLPKKFQKEKDLFTINMNDGSINCTLCDCKIDPLYMKDHLQGEIHLLQKKLKTT